MKPTSTDTQQIERDIQGPTLSEEQAADLGALQLAAGGAEPPPGAEPEPQGPDVAKEIAGMMIVLVQTLKPAFPSLSEIYTEETVGAASTAIAAVCNKHGWLGGGLFGQWGEEIACLAVVGPLAFATYQGVSGDIEKIKAKRQQQQGPRTAQPLAGPDLSAPVQQAPEPSKTVTFGAAA